MTTTLTMIEALPAVLVLGVASPIACGLALFAWGRRIPRYAGWIAGVSLLLLLAAAAFAWSQSAAGGFHAEAWLRGWVWPREDSGAITVGILRDPAALVMSSLAALVAGALLMSGKEIVQEPRAERFPAALAVGAAGVAVSWIAATPWFAFAGTLIAVFGGFIALGSRWDRDAESHVATRFALERSCGLLLSLLGACILAGPRAALLLGRAEAWPAADSPFDVAGALLLAAGALAQTQPFPLIGWLMSPSEVPSQMRVSLTQVFPAWSAFALLVRLEPQLRALGVFPGFGWVGVVSAALAVTAGLFQSEWRLSLGAWASASLSLAFAALAFAGPGPATAMLIGAGLGACALACGARALEAGGGTSQSNRARAIWSKASIFVSAAAGTGMIGFVAAGGGLRWLASAWAEPAVSAVFAVAVFLAALLGWKVAWAGARVKNHTQAHWASVLSPFVLILVSLGILWTGTASGDAIPGSPDRVMSSLLSLLYGSASDAVADEGAFLSASGLYWGALVMAVALAYWLSGRKHDLWQGFSKALPRYSAFVTGGYGVDAAWASVGRALCWIGSSSQLLVDRKIWGDWLPAALFAGVRRGSGALAAADGAVWGRVGSALRKGVDVPAKALQLVQNGDVQWYLFFAVGSGIALLVHFLRM